MSGVTMVVLGMMPGRFCQLVQVLCKWPMRELRMVLQWGQQSIPSRRHNHDIAVW